MEIEISGKDGDIANFLEELEANPPPLAVIDEMTIEESDRSFSEFKILKSSNLEEKTALVPSDIAICDDCVEEIFDENSHRYQYPLTNCTNCGPRYSIIKTVPYDREQTSLKEFVLCEKCLAEFIDPTNRRYHAQAISCEVCGPTTFLYDNNQDLIASKIEAIDLASNYIKSGKILAIKGMGGFHIVCDATNDRAIKRVREFKKRATKPFAVMFKDLENIKKYAYISEKEESFLVSKERPIVLLKKRECIDPSDLVAPNIDRIGCFLPNSALDFLLFKNLDTPIVATSANLKSEPIITTKEDIFYKLKNLVDFVLDYNREILNSTDDSIVQVVDNQPLKLRNSRGYTPNSLRVDGKFSKKVLSLGANQKSTFSIAFDNKIVTSGYLGDLETIESIERYKKTVKSFLNFYDFVPEVIVCDKHPNYESTKLASDLKRENPKLDLIEVQHHYAHALAVMAEHNIKDSVLAFVFDGTGYGDDKTIWGGEVFIANKSEYKRAYHLNSFKLLGGEKAIKEPKRVALSLLLETFSLEEILSSDLATIKEFEKKEIELLYTVWQKGLNSPLTSSFGRLFDAVASLADILHIEEYEGEAGLYIENLYDSSIVDSYTFEIVENRVDFGSMIKEIVKDRDNKKLIASKFINSIVKMVVTISNLHRELPVVLCGGVFQNRTLVELILREFSAMDRKVYLPQKHSPNDESISVGQAYFTL